MWGDNTIKTLLLHKGGIKMKQDTIIDSHNKSKLDFYSFIWEYFGVSPTEYKTSKDKFKRTMMSEYENYLEEEENY